MHQVSHDRNCSHNHNHNHNRPCQVQVGEAQTGNSLHSNDNTDRPSYSLDTAWA